MTIPEIPKPANPTLTDEVIAQIQDVLKAKLSWLDYSFGKAQRLTELKDRKKRYFPGVHIANGRYINVFPDQGLGNFSFFKAEDPQTVNFIPHNSNTVKTPCSIIFWFNLNDVFSNSPDRNIEAVKAQILKILTSELFLTAGRISVFKIYEYAENVYKGYSIDEIESQFLMQPYAGIRFECEILTVEKC